MNYIELISDHIYLNIKFTSLYTIKNRITYKALLNTKIKKHLIDKINSLDWNDKLFNKLLNKYIIINQLKELQESLFFKDLKITLNKEPFNISNIEIDYEVEKLNSNNIVLIQLLLTTSTIPSQEEFLQILNKVYK